MLQTAALAIGARHDIYGGNQQVDDTATRARKSDCTRERRGRHQKRLQLTAAAAGNEGEGAKTPSYISCPT